MNISLSKSLSLLLVAINHWLMEKIAGVRISTDLFPNPHSNRPVEKDTILSLFLCGRIEHPHFLWKRTSSSKQLLRPQWRCDPDSEQSLKPLQQLLRPQCIVILTREVMPFNNNKLRA
ncbi:hypothetical protein C5167_000355 [Papaver somniferum]|uniref:Uncharacterized protein n=1 Tax=Papaver somniferum TaxID=3469 RepID=A0A4Y7KUZ9_PAPSO|nr:hypothetical protein C5167_000355 [Papaver somniferum]